MLDILNALYLATVLSASVTLYPEGETFVSDSADGAAVAVAFNREWWREDGQGKCRFLGVVVPIDRTWPLEVDRGGTRQTLPAEPGKLAAYVALIHRKVCKDTAPEHMLRAGLVRTRTVLFGGGGPQVDKQMFFQAGNLLETPDDQVQPWLPRAVERLVGLAHQDPAVQAFLTASAPELDRKLPGWASPSPVAKGAQAPATAPGGAPSVAP